MSIIDGVLEETNHAAGISAVHLRWGPLSGVDKDALLAAYEIASEGTLLQGTSLIFQDCEVVIRCTQCQADRPCRAFNHLECAECGGPAERLVSGQDFEITAVEVRE